MKKNFLNDQSGTFSPHPEVRIETGNGGATIINRHVFAKNVLKKIFGKPSIARAMKVVDLTGGREIDCTHGNPTR